MAKSKAKQTMYKQCSFRSPTEDGEKVHTAWIPTKFAEVGRKVYFGKKTDTPDRIWEVTTVSEPAISEEYLVEHERDYLTQRAASDI